MLKSFFKTLVLLCCFQSLLHSELLIVVKDNGVFRAMTHEETIRYQAKISEVLLKYQWPMCTQSDLTSEEVLEYLAPNKPYAEEQFVQKKLQEAISPSEIDLNVMFVPTSLYELFCVNDCMDNPSTINLQAVNATKRHFITSLDHVFIDAVGYDKPLAESRQKVHDIFTERNKLFFNTSSGENVSENINNKLVSFLFNKFPEITVQESILAVSNMLKNHVQMIQTELIEKIITGRKIPELGGMAAYLQKESKTHIISKVVSLEYEARELNKALLLRGSSFLKNPFADSTSRVVAGITFLTTKSDNLVHDYLQDQIQPFSISFGSSLFAGALGEHTACAYYYLNRSTRAIGYALLVDKKAYVQNRNNHLFFIPPLAPIASLFGEGLFFHPRTTVAISQKKDLRVGYSALGFNAGGRERTIRDFTDFLLFIRDPLKHSELFSEYLAQHGRIIQLGNENDFSPEEKRFVHDVVRAQKNIAQSHKQIRVLTQRMLNKLYRIGNQPIPGFSETELFDILQTEPTMQEYKRLQATLSTISPESLTLTVPEQINVKTILSARSNYLLQKTTSTFGRKTVEEQSETMTLLIELARKKIFFAQHVDLIMQMIQLAVMSADDAIKSQAINLINRIEYLLKSPQVHYLFPLIGIVMQNSINSEQRLGIQDKVMDIVGNWVFAGLLESTNVIQALSWIDMTMNNPNKHAQSRAKRAFENIINFGNMGKRVGGDVIYSKIISPEYATDMLQLLEKHKDLWPDTERIKLQNDLLEIIPKGSSKKGSMLDFAVHGTGALRTTAPNLMRYNPIQDKSMVQPSHEQLEAQRSQLQRFNAEYQQQIAQAKEGQLVGLILNIPTQPRLIQQQPPMVQPAQWTAPSLTAMKTKIGRMAPRIIR